MNDKWEEGVLCMTKHKLLEVLEEANKEDHWSHDDVYKIKAAVKAIVQIMTIAKAMHQEH